MDTTCYRISTERLLNLQGYDGLPINHFLPQLLLQSKVFQLWKQVIHAVYLVGSELCQLIRVFEDFKQNKRLPFSLGVLGLLPELELKLVLRLLRVHFSIFNWDFLCVGMRMLCLLKHRFVYML